MIKAECLTILLKCKSKKFIFNMFFYVILRCTVTSTLTQGNISIPFTAVLCDENNTERTIIEKGVFYECQFFDFRKAKTQRYQHHSLNKRVACSVILELYLQRSFLKIFSYCVIIYVLAFCVGHLM